jgi:serine protease inhibitor
MTMNKRIIVALAFALTASACAQQSAEKTESAPAGARAESDEAVTASERTDRDGVAEEEAKAVPVAALVNGNNQFALDVLKHVDSGTVAYSPYAMSVAGLMLQTGAEGDTREQLRGALRLNLTEDVVDSKVATLRERLQDTTGKGFKVGSTSQVWLANDVSARGEWTQRVTRIFGINVEVGDMSNAQAARTVIDETVASATVNAVENITRDYPLGEGKFAITTAATPGGAWEVPFQRALTTEAIFTNPDGTKGRRPVMRGNGRFPYWENGKMQVVALPYEGDATAIIVLPRDGTFASVEGELSQYPRLSYIVGALRNRQVAVTLPKVDIRTSLDLTTVFKSMGASAAFGDGAEFEPALGADSTAVDLMAHETLFSIDEDGTRAQARAAQSDRSADGATQFEATRPFLIFVRHNTTGQLLIVARVM